MPVVNERIVGSLIALYERAVGFYASLVNINAYHQPGVEAGKKAAASILSLQRDILNALKSTKNPLTIAELAEKAGSSEEIETVYQIVRHLSANNRGVTLSGDRHQPANLTVSAS